MLLQSEKRIPTKEGARGDHYILQKQNKITE